MFGLHITCWVSSHTYIYISTCILPRDRPLHILICRCMVIFLPMCIIYAYLLFNMYEFLNGSRIWMEVMEQDFCYGYICINIDFVWGLWCAMILILLLIWNEVFDVQQFWYYYGMILWVCYLWIWFHPSRVALSYFSSDGVYAGCEKIMVSSWLWCEILCDELLSIKVEAWPQMILFSY